MGSHHVLCPIQCMECGQSLPVRLSCPASYSVHAFWPDPSSSTIMSYVLFSGWGLASQSLPARPSCPMSHSVDGVWPASLFMLDHHVLCPVQYMESGQPDSSAGPSCPMSCSVHGVWPVSSLPARPSCPMHYVLPIAGRESSGGPRERC
jgi:hypothetical protein